MRRARGGHSLVCGRHCFAGVNRSAALALAMLMRRERTPLLEAARHCWANRPFILSNESFRLQLCKWARAQGLLDGYAANYAEVS